MWDAKVEAAADVAETNWKHRGDLIILNKPLTHKDIEPGEM